MRHRIFLVLFIALGCSKSEPPKNAKAPTVESNDIGPSTSSNGQKSDQLQKPSKKPLHVDTKTPKTSEGLARPVPSLRSLTSASFAAEVEGMSTCTARTETSLKQCPAYQRVLTILADRDAESTHRRFLQTSAANRLVEHPSPAVRWLAIRLLRSIAQVEASSREKLEVRLVKETEPFVLASLLRTLGLFIEEDTALFQRYRTLSDHESEQVRASAIRWVTRASNHLDETQAEFIDSKLKDDPSAAVGRAICLELARKKDDRGIAKIISVIQTPEATADTPCFLSLTSTWIAPSLNAISQLGFSATLEELKRRVEGEVRIPWAVMARLGQGRHLVARSKFTRAQQQLLQQRLLAVVHSKSQDIQVRVGAVQALGTYGATPQMFDEIVTAYQSANDTSYQLAARAKMYRTQSPQKP